MSRPAHTYTATVQEVITGQLVRLDVDLGWHIHHRITATLAGVSARDLEMDGGEEARRFLADLIPPGSVVTFHSVRIEPSGRTAGVILAGDGRNVAVEMARAGYAVVWDGRGPRRLPLWPPVPARVVTRRLAR